MADPATQAAQGQGWSGLRTTGPTPKARGGHTATLVDKNLLVLGGQQHMGSGKFEYFSVDPHVLDTETLAWFQPRVALGKSPAPRSYHTTTRVGAALFVFGGQTEKKPGTSGVLGDLPVFDLVRMCWEKRDARGKQPRARYWHSAALLDGKLFVFGGYSGSQARIEHHQPSNGRRPGVRRSGSGQDGVWSPHAHC
jgi:N-acetylneuraminic acid mutarotase